MTKHKYRLLKNCTRGRRGDIVEVHGNDVSILRKNGIIGTQEIEPKAPTETKAAKKKGRPRKDVK